jgi:hypothetical protein
MAKSKDSRQYSKQYIQGYRKYSIYQKIAARNVQCYGEVSGTLRHHVESLQEVFPWSKMMLLVRDGRDVIRSVWRFDFYKEGTRGAYNLKPQQSDPYYERWNGMSRFEKLCWSWMWSIEYALQYIPAESVIHFESIIRDYEYFREKVLIPLGLNMKEDVWREGMSSKSPNATKQYVFPHWKDWSSIQKEAFKRICGLSMRKLGYELSM